MYPDDFFHVVFIAQKQGSQ
uniref:Uncharacterized protein n=1 Tax=Anguilla anguilla TaxID=7936 RepID=A0A0E9XAZ0_ANGAN